MNIETIPQLEAFLAEKQERIRRQSMADHPAAHLVQDFVDVDAIDNELGSMHVAFARWALQRYGSTRHAEHHRDATVFAAGWLAAMDFAACETTEAEALGQP